MNLCNFPTIIDRKLKIGIVGCGRISKNHFDSILQNGKDLELSAVCDLDPKACEIASKKYKVKGYTDIKQMLTEVEPDLAAVTKWPSPEQAIISAQFGVHVVSEKPMATCYEAGLRMVKACDLACVRLFVVKQNRRNATLQLLKRAITEKRFGNIKMVHLNVF